MINFNKEDIAKRASEASNKLRPAIGAIGKNPSMPFIIIGLILVVVFVAVLSGKSKVPDAHPAQAEPIPFKQEEGEMVGVKESVDPRDVWTAKVQHKVDETKEEFAKKLDEKKQQGDSELQKVQNELNELKEVLRRQQQIYDARNIESSLTVNTKGQDLVVTSSAPRKSIGQFSKSYRSTKKNFRDYVAAGSFARAVLMTGVVVGTGANSQSNPEPVRLRLTDAAILSMGLRTEQLKEAILIGDCHGDLSSERARCHLQTLSLENRKGEIIERPVQGWIIGEEGRNGVRGMVVDKSSDMLRMAMLNGVLGGMSQFLQNQSTKGAFPISPLTGQQNALSGVSTLKGGLAHGTGDAFSKMADFVMERFNSMSPQIVIASGREVDVVFKTGIDLNDNPMGTDQAKVSDGNLGRANHKSSQTQVRPNYPNEGVEAFSEVMLQMNNGINRPNSISTPETVYPNEAGNPNEPRNTFDDMTSQTGNEAIEPNVGASIPNVEENNGF